MNALVKANAKLAAAASANDAANKEYLAAMGEGDAEKIIYARQACNKAEKKIDAAYRAIRRARGKEGR